MWGGATNGDHGAGSAGELVASTGLSTDGLRCCGAGVVRGGFCFVPGDGGARPAARRRS